MTNRCLKPDCLHDVAYVAEGPCGAFKLPKDMPSRVNAVELGGLQYDYPICALSR